jgi:hypothetical protein
MKLRFSNKAPLVASLAAVLFLASYAANAAVINFNPGIYSLSTLSGGTPVDTLTIALNAGMADFTLTGQDSATFSVIDHSVPDGFVFSDSPYYDSGSGKVISTSWDSSLYPFLTFYTTANFGGFSVGTTAGDISGTDLFDLYSTNQLFSVSSVPLPASLPLMLTGLGMLGFAAVRKNCSTT